MGFPRLHRRAGAALPGVSADDARPRSTGLIEDGGRVAGVRAETPAGGLDGSRRSRRRRRRPPFDRARAGRVRDRRSRRADGRAVDAAVAASRRSGADLGPHRSPAAILVMLNRDDLLAMRLCHRQGRVRRDPAGAACRPSARRSPGWPLICASAPASLRDWDDVKLLSVAVDRLRIWHRPGLLCIGDAAHAMSPIGGVGINLAIQDAVAAANILARPLLTRTRPRRRSARGSAPARSFRPGRRSGCRWSCRTG